MTFFDYGFLSYFFLTNFFYFMIYLVAMVVIFQNRRRVAVKTPTMFPPVSILMPAYNEENVIVESLNSLFLLRYPIYEIIVINDGSTDATFTALQKAFSLQPHPFVTHANDIETQLLRGFYSSTTHPRLKVIDKRNGGKADSLNAGLNRAQYPFYCCIDADGILDPDCLRHLIQPFLQDPSTVAVGGTVRLANGCHIRHGALQKAKLSSRLLPCVQALEYLRAFFMGRMFWSSINALLIISGALGVFQRDLVVELGGYTPNLLGEDMELVVRMHRHLRLTGRRYRICYVPDPLCWTEAPESFAQLRKQRVRWQRGMMESLYQNRSLLGSWQGGAVGLLAMPFALVIEGFGPVFELFGACYVIVGGILGFVTLKFVAVFFVLSVSVGLMFSSFSILVEELAFKTYPRFIDLLRLFWAALLENTILRPLFTYWRLQGTLAFFFSKRKEWGTLNRLGLERQ